MKVAVLLMVAFVACVSAMSLEGLEQEDKALPKCNNNNVGNKYPFRNNPRKFWLCTYRGLLLQKCQKGTWYNNNEQACVTDEESCEPEEPVPEESEESEESAETDAPVESEESVEEPIEEETEAPVESSEEATEEPIEEETEAPVESSEESVEEPIEEETEAPEESEETTEEEPVEEETDAPPQESSEESEETDAPAPSSEESGEPVEEETEKPTSPPETCSPVCNYHGEYLQNPDDCHSFFQCSWGVPYLHQCPLMDDKGNRLVFNPTIDVCDWPWAYACNGSPGCGQPEPEPECPAVNCEYNGQYFADPADCHSFYQCAPADNDGGLRAVHHNCAMENAESRLVFNTKLNVCDWSYNVPCQTSC